MSRVARKPITIPSGVEIKQDGLMIKIKGPKGQLECHLPDVLSVQIDGSELSVLSKANDEKSKQSAKAMTLAGTFRAKLNNIITGVAKGFEKKLLLVGVGYRAQVQGKILNLSLGFSHPTNFAIPEGIVIEAPSQTEIVIKGFDKQLVGQVAANIRAMRSVEPYKGKGIRYENERFIKKETKKK